MKYRSRLLISLGLIALVAMTLGCATAPSQSITSAAPKLKEDLLALGPKVDPEEAERLANGLLLETQALARQYNTVGSSNLQNVLVNLGARERGLCWHYAVDLLAYARSLNLASFDLYWAVAHEGFPLKEHSCLVVTARGEPFSTGLVVDGWREPRRLFWIPVVRDAHYPWKVHYEAPPATGS